MATAPPPRDRAEADGRRGADAGLGESTSVALLRVAPALTHAVPWAVLGRWPTPIEPAAAAVSAAAGGEVWIKREDLAHPWYGGNKLRTLELLLAAAHADGARRIWSTGGYGSNHALATAIHAPRLGLEAGAMLFPQPAEPAAQRNLRALASTGATVVAMASPLRLPWVMRRHRRQHPDDRVMPPGGASPRGALGAVSAMLELADQVAAGLCPRPRQVVVPAGSTTTAAGLLAGAALAARLGAWPHPPLVRAVAISPWPITEAWRIARLAAAALAELVGPLGPVAAIPTSALRRGLVVDHGYLGAGYGHPTGAAAWARAVFARAAGAHQPPLPELDPVYTAKTAACVLDVAGHAEPTVFWLTRSSARLPADDEAAIARLPAPMRTWLGPGAGVT
jgi:D-cysteine desulfhydrase